MTNNCACLPDVTCPHRVPEPVRAPGTSLYRVYHASSDSPCIIEMCLRHRQTYSDPKWTVEQMAPRIDQARFGHCELCALEERE